MLGRTAIKSCLLAANRLLGVQALARHRGRDRLLVLCYHGVVARDRSTDRYLYRNTVGAGEFAAQLRSLRGYHPVAASQVVRWLRGGEPLPEHAVLITFDDGYRNNLTLAAPILAELGVPALVSVTTDYVGTDRVLWAMEVDLRIQHWPEPVIPAPDGRELALTDRNRDQVGAVIRRQCKQIADAARRAWLDGVLRRHPLPAAVLADDELWRFLSWDEVRALRRHGIEIASHTCSHPILSRVPADQCARELVASKQKIEQELGEECPVFVYPNGGAEDVTAAVVQGVRDAGYAAAFTLMEQVNPVRPDPHLVDRIGVPGHAGMEAFHFRTSGLRSMLRSLRGA